MSRILKALCKNHTNSKRKYEVRVTIHNVDTTVEVDNEFISSIRISNEKEGNDLFPSISTNALQLQLLVSTDSEWFTNPNNYVGKGITIGVYEGTNIRFYWSGIINSVGEENNYAREYETINIECINWLSKHRSTYMKYEDYKTSGYASPVDWLADVCPGCYLYEPIYNQLSTMTFSWEAYLKEKGDTVSLWKFLSDFCQYLNLTAFVRSNNTSEQVLIIPVQSLDLVIMRVISLNGQNSSSLISSSKDIDFSSFSIISSNTKLGYKTPLSKLELDVSVGSLKDESVGYEKVDWSANKEDVKAISSLIEEASLSANTLRESNSTDKNRVLDFTAKAYYRKGTSSDDLQIKEFNCSAATFYKNLLTSTLYKVGELQYGYLPQYSYGKIYKTCNSTDTGAKSILTDAGNCVCGNVPYFYNTSKKVYAYTGFVNRFYNVVDNNKSTFPLLRTASELTAGKYSDNQVVSAISEVRFKDNNDEYHYGTLFANMFDSAVTIYRNTFAPDDSAAYLDFLSKQGQPVRNFPLTLTRNMSSVVKSSSDIHPNIKIEAKAILKSLYGDYCPVNPFEEAIKGTNAYGDTIISCSGFTNYWRCESDNYDMDQKYNNLNSWCCPFLKIRITADVHTDNATYDGQQAVFEANIPFMGQKHNVSYAYKSLDLYSTAINANDLAFATSGAFNVNCWTIGTTKFDTLTSLNPLNNFTKVKQGTYTAKDGEVIIEFPYCSTDDLKFDNIKIEMTPTTPRYYRGGRDGSRWQDVYGFTSVILEHSETIGYRDQIDENNDIIKTKYTWVNPNAIAVNEKTLEQQYYSGIDYYLGHRINNPSENITFVKPDYTTLVNQSEKIYFSRMVNQYKDPTMKFVVDSGVIPANVFAYTYRRPGVTDKAFKVISYDYDVLNGSTRYSFEELKAFTSDIEEIINKS